MKLRTNVHSLVLLFLMSVVLHGCWNSEYDRIEGRWHGELKGQHVVAEFHPSEDAVVIDGRSGVMRVTSENDGTLVLDMTGPDGRTGEAVITVLDEQRIRFDIPNTAYSVELTRVESLDGTLGRAS